MHTVSHVVWGVSKHLAFGYLVYSVVRHRRGRSPTGWTTVALLVGIAFPDLVDKSLAAASVVGYGRSFAHSLLTATAVLAAVTRLAHRWESEELGAAFAVGYLSHLPVDMYGPLLTGYQSMDTAFLFWPVVVEYSLGVPTPELPVGRDAVFTAVIASALSLWLSDRLPPLSGIAHYARSRWRTRSGNDR